VTDSFAGRPGAPGELLGASGSASPASPSAGGGAESAVCRQTPTRCQASVRLYRNGVLEAGGFPVADISDHLADDSVVVWLDLLDPGPEDLAVLVEEFQLHPLAVEDAVHRHERPTLDRYRDHLFMSAYAAHLELATGELATSELAAFITPQALITVRKDEKFGLDGLLKRWDDSPHLAVHGVAFLLHGLIDDIVDGHFAAVQVLDEQIEQLQDQLFTDTGHGTDVQRRSFELRKSLVTLRRIVLPMREVVNSLMRRDIHLINEEMSHYYQDIYDHVLQASEWTESLRDLVTTILETRLTIQGNRLNEIMKKLTSWAAIIASPPPSPASTARTCPTPASNKSGGSYAASCSSWSSGEPSTWCSNANSGYKNHQGETRPPRSGSPRAERLGCVVALAGVRAGSSNGTASVGAWRATARGRGRRRPR